MSRREEDVAEEMFVINSHDYVMFFTNLGRVYRLKCYEIPEGSRTSKGMNIVNLLPLSGDEKVTSMIRVPEFDEESYLVMVTRKGTIKRTELSAFDTARKGGLIALTLEDGDELAWVRVTNGSDELLVATRHGMAIRFSETDVRPMGRTARGVRAIQLREGDEVVGMSIVRDGGLVLTVSETGYGRLLPRRITGFSPEEERALSTTIPAGMGTWPPSRWWIRRTILFSFLPTALLSAYRPIPSVSAHGPVRVCVLCACRRAAVWSL